MRHAKKRSRLNRFTSWRKATIRSLAQNLITYQSIRTSLSKAKAARPLAEKLISLAKQNDLASKRVAYSILGNHALVSHLFTEIGPRFSKYQGGYTRIIPLGIRRGDSTSVVLWELTEIKKKEAKKPKKEAAEMPKKPEAGRETPAEEARPRTETAVKEEKHPKTQKPQKKFFGGIKSIFKKERDSL
ncbi:MAG: 50S ribosomal protein L17 [Candidatus Omnitrophica bacterium]|nr:50S ribosomal protein L17 [Candidatus Omnitrophota bacterium]